jgi:glycosyltransferase involved in cell wall biosynthesis
MSSTTPQQPVPRVSIGVPVYNGEQYLAEALASILAQSYGNFEVIISDNGSTDGSEAICREYVERDARIQYHRAGENRGAAWNYNRVFELARGEIFKWAPCDDKIAPEFLERCVAAFDAHPGAVLVYTDTIYIDAEGREIKRVQENMHLRHAKPRQRLTHYYRHLNMCTLAITTMRRETLATTRLIDTFMGCDYVLLAEMAMRGTFAEVPEFLTYRRIHEKSSVKANKTKHKIDQWFNPRARRRILGPKAKLFVEFVRSTLRAELPPGEKLMCVAAVGVWVLQRLRDQTGLWKARLRGKSPSQNAAQES